MSEVDAPPPWPTDSAAAPASRWAGSVPPPPPAPPPGWAGSVPPPPPAPPPGWAGNVPPPPSTWAAPTGLPGQNLRPPQMGASRVQGRPTIWAQNRHSLTVLLVVAGYLVLAAATGIVLLGIFPVMLALRATRAKEPLGMIAVVAAGGAVVAAMVAVAR
jgi:hypothetical protein